MRAVRNIVIGLVVLLIVGVGGVVLFLLTLDANDYRDEIAGAARQATGRDLTLGGPLDLEISLTPAIVARDVTLANAPWGSKPDMVRLRRLEVRVELLPLISGAIKVRRLILSGADILLETDAKGRGNWEFGAAVPAEATPGEAPGAVPLPKLVEISASTLTYRDGQTGEVTVVALNRLTATADSYAQPLTLDLDASLNEAAIKARGTIGPLGRLSAPEPYPVDLTLDAFGIAILLKGSVRNALTAPTFDFALGLKAADLSGLKPIIGDAAPSALALDLKAGLSGDASRVTLADLALTLGASDLSGKLQADLAGARPKITAVLTSNKLDLTELMAPQQDAGAQKPASKTDKVFSPEPLPFDGLKAADADVRLTVTKLITPSLPLADVTLGLKLAGGKLTLDPLRSLVAGSALGGTITLDASTAPPALKVDLASPALDLGRLLTEADVTDLLEGKAEFAVDLSGRGRSVAEIMASLNGETKLLMGQGRARTKAFDVLVGGLSAVMGGLFAGKSEWTVLNCVANVFDFKQGVATAKVILVDTEYSTVVGEGSVDLGAEKLKLKVTPSPKSTTLNLSLPIKVRGTLADPTFTPDELATARRVGGLLGAIAFPPAALLALGDLGAAADNPCVELAQKGAQGGAGGSAGGVSGTVKEVTKSATDAVKGILGGGAAKKKKKKKPALGANPVEGVTKGLKSLFGD